MHNSSPENGCEGDLIETHLNLNCITDYWYLWYLSNVIFTIIMGFIQWKSKIFFENGVKSSVRKVSVSVENFLEWKSDGAFFIANVIFFSLLSFSAEWQIFYFSRWPVCCLAAWPGEDIGKRWESRVTWSPHDVTVCGTKVQVKRCRGTCRSISRITMGFPYYRKYCQCCQGNKFTDKTVSCAGGGHKKSRYPAGWSCEDCLA